MAGEEYGLRGAPGEDYREVNNRRQGGQQPGQEDYREVTREKMRFLRTLTVRRSSSSLIISNLGTKLTRLKTSGDPKPWFRLGPLHPLRRLPPGQEHQVRTMEPSSSKHIS